MKRVLLLDNEDSFTYLFADRLRRVSDVLSITIVPERQAETAMAAACDALILSPGPGLPQEHPVDFALLRAAPEGLPLLGICLGCQILGLYYGARLQHLAEPRHGQCRPLLVRGSRLLPEGESRVGLYHSWALAPQPWPEDLLLAGRDDEGLPMLLEHRRLPRFGVQFHPESLLTERGDELLQAFAALI